HGFTRSAVTRIDQPGEGDPPSIVDRIAKEGAAELPASRGRGRIRHDELTGRAGALVEAKDASSPEVGTAPNVREGDIAAVVDGRTRRRTSDWFKLPRTHDGGKHAVAEGEHALAIGVSLGDE